MKKLLYNLFTTVGLLCALAAILRLYSHNIELEDQLHKLNSYGDWSDEQEAVTLIHLEDETHFIATFSTFRYRTNGYERVEVDFPDRGHLHKEAWNARPWGIDRKPIEP